MNQEPREKYTPQEGLDYIVDFYAVIGIDRSTDQDELNKLINQKIKEYHPDKFEGLAEEFQIKANTMTIQLNRAKTILCDSEKREIYDDLLENWTGIISDDGRPIITREMVEKHKRSQMSSEEIETYLESETKMMNQLTGYDPHKVDDLREKLQKLKDNNAANEEIVNMANRLTEALWQEDEAMAFREDLLKEFIGIEPLKAEMDLPSPEYVELTRERLSQAVETETQERVVRLALDMGQKATRLALLESNDSTKKPVDAVEIEVEDIDTEKIKEVLQKFADETLEFSEKRVEIVKEIVATAPLIYPERELQTEPKNKLILMIKEVENELMARVMGEKDHNRYDIFAIEIDGLNANLGRADDKVKDLVAKKQYKELIEGGFGIIIFENMFKVDPFFLIEEIIDRYRSDTGIVSTDYDKGGQDESSEPDKTAQPEPA